MNFVLKIVLNYVRPCFYSYPRVIITYACVTLYVQVYIEVEFCSVELVSSNLKVAMNLRAHQIHYAEELEGCKL